ncbi:MAG: hypothetical protein F6K16_28845 [Symploca sp. SIO2B6]|nr:hypothetical protein [Symploca sp. SIO2B6]
MLPTTELKVVGETITLQVLGTSILLRLVEWTVIGSIQWLLLRCYLKRASWWILASAIGGAIKGGSELITRLVVSNALGGAMIGAFAYGVVTSVVLAWLLGKGEE